MVYVSKITVKVLISLKDIILHLPSFSRCWKTFSKSAPDYMCKVINIHFEKKNVYIHTLIVVWDWDETLKKTDVCLILTTLIKNIWNKWYFIWKPLQRAFIIRKEIVHGIILRVATSQMSSDKNNTLSVKRKWLTLGWCQAQFLSWF